MAKRPRGTYASCVDQNAAVLLVSWNDNISIVDQVNLISAAKRWICVIAQYNHYIGGVDRMDQKVENYRVGVKSKKWF